jgi:hypothetical protein
MTKDDEAWKDVERVDELVASMALVLATLLRFNTQAIGMMPDAKDRTEFFQQFSNRLCQTLDALHDLRSITQSALAWAGGARQKGDCPPTPGGCIKALDKYLLKAYEDLEQVAKGQMAQA